MSFNTPIFWIGAPNRVDTREYPKVVMLVVGPQKYLGHFRDANEFNTFWKEYMNIKYRMSDIMDDKTTTTDERDLRVKNNWCPMVRKFVQKWGPEFLPGDVRHSFNDVEVNLLKVRATVWPVFHTFKQDNRFPGVCVYGKPMVVKVDGINTNVDIFPNDTLFQVRLRFRNDNDMEGYFAEEHWKFIINGESVNRREDEEKLMACMLCMNNDKVALERRGNNVKSRG